MNDKNYSWKDDLNYTIYGEMAERHYEGKKELPYAIVATSVLASWAWQFTMRGVCKVKGHDLEERDCYSSYGSGRVDVHCKRCGQCWGGYW